MGQKTMKPKYFIKGKSNKKGFFKKNKRKGKIILAKYWGLVFETLIIIGKNIILDFGICSCSDYCKVPQIPVNLACLSSNIWGKGRCCQFQTQWYSDGTCTIEWSKLYKALGCHNFT